jgi:hypothetical protein
MMLTGVLASQLVASVNVIENGTFDNADAGWSPIYRNGSNTAPAGSNYVSFSDGVCLLKRTSSLRAGVTVGGISQDIYSLVAGATYELQFDYRVDGIALSPATPTYSARLGSGTTVNGEIGSSSNIKVNVVAGSESFSLTLFANTGDNALVAIIDDVVLTKT